MSHLQCEPSSQDLDGSRHRHKRGICMLQRHSRPTSSEAHLTLRPCPSYPDCAECQAGSISDKTLVAQHGHLVVVLLVDQDVAFGSHRSSAASRKRDHVPSTVMAHPVVSHNGAWTSVRQDNNNQ